jgi:energy-coupling factor transporter transmembrane protein EcfT
MRTILLFIRGLLALAVLAALVVSLLWLARIGLRSLFDGVDPGVASAIAAGFFALLVSIGGVLFTRMAERRKAAEEQIRQQKTPIYEDLIERLFLQLNSVSDTGEVDTDATAQLFARLTPKLIIWGADDVVVAWSRWRRGLTSGTIAGMDVMFEFESVLKAIRKDLGHSGANVGRGDLLGLFINDVDDHLSTRPQAHLKPAS